MKQYLRNWEFPHELVIYERRVAAMRRNLNGERNIDAIIACGGSFDRDFNSSINIYERGMRFAIGGADAPPKAEANDLSRW